MFAFVSAVVGFAVGSYVAFRFGDKAVAFVKRVVAWVKSAPSPKV